MVNTSRGIFNLHQDKTWDYAEPKHLDMYVEDLKDQDLKNYGVST